MLRASCVLAGQALSVQQSDYKAAASGNQPYPPYPPHFRSRVSLASLVGRNAKLERAGRLWKACCPFHEEKTPSFTIYEDDHYHCFGCGAHGDAIDFLRRIEGLSFAEAKERAGDLSNRFDTSPRRERGTGTYAAKLLEKSRPIIGTLAERYLREARRFGDLPLPEELRFHPAVWSGETRKTFPALLVPCFEGRRVARLQAILIDPATGGKAPVKSPKVTFGRGASHVPASFAARVPGDWVLLSEGPEKAVALHAVMGWRSDASLNDGSLRKPLYGPGTNLVIFGDNGDVGHKHAQAAAEAHRARKVNVWLVFPPEGIKDGDELLVQRGPDAVRACIDAVLARRNDDRSSLRRCEPPRRLPTATLTQAHAFHAQTMLEFYRTPEECEQPMQILMSGQGGTGKTEAAARFAREEPRRQIVLVPEHQVLGAQVVERYRDLGIHVAPLVGRGDPFDPKPTDLCSHLEDVAEALKADQHVAKSVCGTLDGPHCPSFATCPYQQMKRRAAQAKVVVGSSNWLFHPLPKEVAKDIGRLVVEEDFTPHGVWIFPLTLECFGATALAKWPVRHDGEPDEAATRKLEWFGWAVNNACEQDGDLSAEALRSVGLRQENFVEAIRLIRRRRVESVMVPGMSLKARREAVANEAINGQISKLVIAVSIMQEVFDGTGPGRITIETTTTRRGVSRDIVVHTTLKVADWAREIPVLLVNGTPQIETVRQFFPRVVERKPPEVIAPHAETHLVLGGFAKTTVARSKSKRLDLNRFLGLQALGQDRVSLVSFKSLKGELADGVPGMLPPRHHLQNAGDDELRDVSLHVVQDGIRPPTREVARLVRAKTGRSPSMAPPVAHRGRALLADGTGLEVSVLGYEDREMQAECEHHLLGSISQALARSRSVMRTALNPVRNILLGNVAPPVEVVT